MRVTKLIREYVEKRVNAAYPKSEAELIWEEKSRRTHEALTRANGIIEAYSKKIAEELNAEFGLGDYKLEPFEGRNWFCASWYGDCAEYKASRKAEEERHKKIRETVEEILISLELGGTKAELEEMLANIGK